MWLLSIEYELFFVDFVNFGQSCKNQSLNNVGDPTIIKNKN